MASADVRNLRKVYDSVDDIDLFTGGILERNHKDGLVGPTFKCIIGDQFLRLKRGDRFYYEYGTDPTTRFSEAQLQELRKTSLARLHCDNSNIKRVQPLVFRMPTRGNELVSCTDGSIPRVNLDVFRE
jgi:peroxidase